MNKQQAIDLVRATFESPFNRERYANFIGRLLNQMERDPFTYTGQFIPDAFRATVSKYERLGKYNDDEGKRVDILIVYLQRESSVERARATQRRFIAGYLQGKYGSSADKDAALVAFVSAENAAPTAKADDWRFSLVKLETRLEATAKGGVKVVDEFTPARRWSFLVGANERSHTAQTRLVPIMQETERNPTLAQLEEAFNIEKVTKEFFEKYRDLFIRTKAELDKAVVANPKAQADLRAKGVDTVNLAKKLLGQIVFLYYLQKKGWFGVPRDSEWGDGSKQFLRELFAGKHGRYANFFNDILEPLFYEALRIDRSHDDHYYSRFNCRIPFLNGGLFDPMGNYDWVRADILLPNDLFSNQNKTKEGDTGDGILDIFDRYNFTVREDEPFEKEVAIDPELLGKAYEKFNAIRPDNYDEFVQALRSGKKGEESKFNKQYGVYYTPREIVHYMCQQSLIHYLATQVGERVSQTEIADLIQQGEAWREHDARVVKEGRETDTYPFMAPSAIREHAALLDEKLAAITVCDPAAGSGAFPVGMMSEIVRARQTLTTYLSDLSGFPKPDRSPYAFKRDCIEHALYGVDIDPGAVEIAKLRLWLSLIVDEEDIRQIKPLPNLDYKIVCGNSLIGFPEQYQTGSGQEIERLIRDHFHETHPTRKEYLKQQIDAKINARYAGSRKALGYQVDFDFRTVFAEVFQHNGGFDVVIGNPPYVQLQKDSGALAKLYQKARYKTFAHTGDIYALFYEKGYQVLNSAGHLCYITSNKWMRAGYGKSLREFFIKHTAPKALIDFGDAPLFANATTYTNILLFGKNRDAATPCRVFDLNHKTNLQENLAIYLNATAGQFTPQFSPERYLIVNQAEFSLKQKVERLGIPLKDWDIEINYGIKTGYNQAFIIDGVKRAELIAADPKSAEIIKPVLRGRDIKRYEIDWQDLWLINSHNGLKNKGIPTIDIPKQFPAIYKHLKEFASKCKNRADQGNHWTNLRNCAYLEEFDKEKIVWAEIVFDSAFYYDADRYYMEATGFMMTGESIKSLVALLNSKLLTYAFRNYFSGGDLRGNTFRYKKAFLEQLPVIKADVATQQKLEGLVDRIQQAKAAPSGPSADTSALETEIDRLVYALYGLTPAEIALVKDRADGR